MLAPIITKDMKLFPSRPIPCKIKNVRSRAQSLDDLKNRSLSRNCVPSSRHRSSQSVGHLPATSRSSPKASSLRKPATLDAIVEGVEMSSSNHRNRSSVSTRRPQPHIAAYTEVRSSPDLEGLCDSDRSLSTCSAPSLEKHSSSGTRTIVKWITGALKSKSKGNCTEGSGKVRRVTACS